MTDLEAMKNTLKKFFLTALLMILLYVLCNGLWSLLSNYGYNILVGSLMCWAFVICWNTAGDILGRKEDDI